jgi:hypothetical protein
MQLHLGLGRLDQLLYPYRVGLGVTMAGERVRPAGRFDPQIGPYQASLDMYGGYFGEVDRDFLSLEPGPLPTRYRLLCDFNRGWKQEIAFGPATGLKNFGWHSSDFRSRAIGLGFARAILSVGRRETKVPGLLPST